MGEHLSPDEITARLAPWRELYETDPTVSQASIAASVGLCVRTVNVYTRRLGWRACSKRRGPPGTSSAPVATTPAGRAAPSVWAWAQGITVSTARHGGRHVEVRA